MKKIFYFLLVLPLFVSGQSTNQNFVKTTVYKQATLTSVTAPAPSVATVQIGYFDGLGRPIQQIANQQSATGKDIIVPIVYDNYGLQAKQYLPYPSSGSSMAYDAAAVTNVTNYSQYAGQTPYGEKQFEASPLNRVQKQAAPGTDWDLPTGASDPDHTVKLDYQNNTVVDLVKLYVAYSTWDNTKGLYEIALTQTGTAYYSNNQLFKTVVKNENWQSSDGKNNTTEEYTNKDNKIVLKRVYSDYKDFDRTLLDSQVAHDTYYVYDQFNNLVYTIPPSVTNVSTQMDGLCYQYKYDYRNRLVEKKLPGKQWEFIVYDKLNRVIKTGPTFSPFSNIVAPNNIGWLITKYDVYNRPVYTGWEQSTTVTSAGRKVLQDSQNNLTTTINESKKTSGTIDGIAAYYSNTVAPTTFKLLTVNYYDNYTFPGVATIPTAVETQTTLTTAKIKTLPSGGWSRVLSLSTSIVGETLSIFYDVKGRIVETYLKNYLGGYTKTDTKLDFVGVPQYTITYHKRLTTDTELKVTDNYSYTPQGRLSTHTQQIGTGAIELISKNDYNELGQLITKRVGGADTTGATSLQKVDYAYNIRGWLTNINDVNDLKTSTENDLFAFKINYNTVDNVLNYTGTPLYNGNISETYWITKNDNIKRKYSYEYDSLNRLKNAVYQKPDDATQLTNSYNESVIYDKTGNIIILQRNGAFDDAALTFQIDYLNYSYTNTNSPNQLMKVTDATNDPSGFKDDSNGINDTSDDYGYDANGNLIRDENKGILNGASNAIFYNHLNLPTKIVFGTTGTIEYLYNANGEKRSKKVTKGSTITTTDYLDGFQYNNNVLIFFPTSEGYVSNTVISGVNSYNYVYNYKDHLGNSRLSYTKDATTGTLKILEENQYYPFGMKHTNYNVNVSYYGHYDPFLGYIVSHPMVDGGPAPVITSGVNSPFKYKFNSMEYQDELGLNMYDFGARNYDPAIGRWMNIDPMAETSTEISPYVYALNNPVYFIDPDGMDEEEFDGWGLGDDGIWRHDANLTNENYNKGDNHYKSFTEDCTIVEGHIVHANGTHEQEGYIYLGDSDKDFHYVDMSQIDEEAEQGREITDSELDLEDHSLSSEISEYTSELMAITISLDGGEPATIEASYIEDILGNAIAGLVYVGEVVNGLNILDSFAQRGANNGKLQDDELQAIKDRIAAGTASSSDLQKLKKHEKNTGDRGSRQSKDKKR